MGYEDPNNEDHCQMSREHEVSRRTFEFTPPFSNRQCVNFSSTDDNTGH